MRTKQSYIDCGKLGAKAKWDKEPPKEVRFWNSVLRGSPGQCWPWNRSLSNVGYGKSYFNGKHVGAHRVAWIITNGPIPPGMCICHRCDNPPCCNPDHLFLGTCRDNAIDAISKGRTNVEQARQNALAKCPKNEDHNCAKFTNAQVREIRAQFAKGGIRKAELSRIYKVAPTTMGKIINGKTYRTI